MDKNIPLEERKEAMLERWTKHKLLLIEEGITKDHIYDAMEKHSIQLRQGATDFFELCHQKDIPIIIFSAAGLGVVSIQRFLEANHIAHDNIHIVGNDFIWDEAGKAIDFKKPIIHSLNKDETALQDYDFYRQDIVDRPNIILIGDGT
jgi:HAD superfamily hydrolase (TIGR01544 family)